MRGTILIAALLLAAPAAAEPVAIAIADGVASGAALAGAGRVPTLVVSEGDAVELAVTADRPMLLHLHGYDVEAAVGPGGPGTIAFTAHAAGRFPVETHAADGHRTILYVEVHPR